MAAAGPRAAFGFHGIDSALSLFRDARGNDQVIAFMEVVWWVDACCEVQWERPTDRPEILLAIRGARNAGAHRLVEPIQVGTVGGLTVPFTVPMAITARRTLMWIPDVASFIRPNDQRAAYRKYLAGREVDQTLNNILSALGEIQRGESSRTT